MLVHKNFVEIHDMFIRCFVINFSVILIFHHKIEKKTIKSLSNLVYIHVMENVCSAEFFVFLPIFRFFFHFFLPSFLINFYDGVFEFRLRTRSNSVAM